MKLSAAVPREHLHTRQVECRGYRREDGLWDIEGHMTDVKTYAFNNSWRGEISGGEPVHDMWLRLTVDDGLLIHEAEAATAAGPFRICGDITPAFAALKGERISPGFHRRARALLGGVKGCTHLVELLVPLATTAIQTTVSSRSRKSTGRASSGKTPRHLNSCHALATDGEVVKEHWPKFYSGS